MPSGSPNTARKNRAAGRISTARLRAARRVLPEQLSIAPPSAPPDRFLLTVLRGDPLGRVIRVEDGDIVIGRSEKASFALADPALSWIHARIFRRGRQIYIEDLASANGTFINEHRIHHPVQLRDGDRIRLGEQTILKLALADALEEDAATRMYESTVRDAVTSVHNRRYLEERLAAEISFAERHEDTLAVMLIDVDNFKHINDEHGHHVGDAVLRVVAAAIQRILRPEDLLARYGGDEFVVLARRITRENACIMAERIRAHVQDLEFPEVLAVRVTVSIGLTAVAPALERCEPSQALTVADTAMYEAKRRGRNCVVAI